MNKDDITIDCPQEFEVRQPRWLLLVSLIFLAVFIGVTTYMTIEVSIDAYELEKALISISLSGVFLFIAILGIYSYVNDTFKYANGEFICKRTLHRTKIWNIDSISYVQVVKYGNRAINIKFVSKSGEKIATVTDGLLVWNDGRLRTVLFLYNIQTEIKEK